MASLSDVVRVLKLDYGLELTISGVFKHMKLLEKAGLVRRESGGIKLEEPDARKTIYMLEGKERVIKILELQERAVDLLKSGLVFKKTAEIARKVRGIGPIYARERKLLESWLNRLEKEAENLTQEEKEKMKLWKIITKYAR